MALSSQPTSAVFSSILTVCTGNICRSPAAEHLLRRRLQAAGWEGRVTSAGLDAMVGHPADETTVAMLEARGIDVSGHRARQLTVDSLRRADLVLVMERQHRDHIVAIDPTARGKTFLLCHWTDAESPGSLPARRRSPCQRHPAHRRRHGAWQQKMRLTRNS